MAKLKFKTAEEEAAHWKGRIDTLRKELEELRSSSTANSQVKFKEFHIAALVRAVKELTGEDY